MAATMDGAMIKRNNGISSPTITDKSKITTFPSAPSSSSNGNTSVTVTATATTDSTVARVKKRKSQPFSSTIKKSTNYERKLFPRNFAFVLIGGAVLLASIQCILNAVLFQALENDTSATATSTTTTTNNNNKNGNDNLPTVPLPQQVANLQTQLRQLQDQTPVYIEDDNFYPFSIRDSRRLVPTQIPLGFHIWDYVDTTTQNQQITRKASLFHNAIYQAPAVCQQYNLYCYKQKIIQVFQLVLQQNPYTQYFFYMEADNELCVPLQDIRRLAYQYQRYFITTGIGFSGWIMQREFMIDFLQELQDFIPPPKDPNDILSQQGPHPSEGPDPIASVMLIDKQAWTVTRKYLVSHSIQPSMGIDALTVKMPQHQPTNQGMAAGIPSGQQQPAAAGGGGGGDATPAGATAAAARGGSGGGTVAGPNGLKANLPQKGLEKHLPRCLEPRRSKWRISKKDHRDRFGWDYFDYDECDGEVFPCYKGQLEDLLEKDMSLFNYTQLDLERKKLIEKQQIRQRKKLWLQQNGGGNNSNVAPDNVAAAPGSESVPKDHHTITTLDEALQEASRQEQQQGDPQNSHNNPMKYNTAMAARFKALAEKTRLRHQERLTMQDPNDNNNVDNNINNYNGPMASGGQSLHFSPSGGGNPGLRGKARGAL